MFEWVLHTPLVLICLYKMEGERRESEAVEDFDITAWKVSKYGVIPGPFFRISGVNLVFSPNTGNCGHEITSYLDTFHAVYFMSDSNSKI